MKYKEIVIGGVISEDQFYDINNIAIDSLIAFHNGMVIGNPEMILNQKTSFKYLYFSQDDKEYKDFEELILYLTNNDIPFRYSEGVLSDDRIDIPEVEIKKD